MEKVIIEVGSTNTKVDLFDGENIKRIDCITIFFKKHYKENNKICEDDVQKLIEEVLKIKEKYSNIYVCGTSIFRNLPENEKEQFLNEFYKKTKLVFNIISQEKENTLTVYGAAHAVDEKTCVFVGGGGSTEISIFDKEIIDSKNTNIGVMDVMEKFPDLANDTASTSVEEVMNYIEKRLNIPNGNADILILAGGDHEVFVRNSGIHYEKNILYSDKASPIMETIESRRKETKRFYEEISLDAIRKRVHNPDWWYAVRAMLAFVLVVAKHVNAKYVIATNISMIYGLINEK